MDVLRLTLRQLQVFTAVAQCGSTTAASEVLALSQSATSSAVGELERVLSLQLFERVGKRLILNDNGRTLLPLALAQLDGAASIERLSRDASAQAATLRIGTSTTLGSYVLPRLLKHFWGTPAPSATQAWQSRIIVGNTMAIGDAIARCELDIGLIEGSCQHGSLHATPWLVDEMVIVAQPRLARTLDESGSRVSLKQLRDLVWLLREPGSGTREATDQYLAPRLGAYRHCIEMGSSEAIKYAVAEGLGVACLSSWVVGDLLSSGKLCILTTTLPRMMRQCHWVVRRGRTMTPALGQFIDCAESMAHAASVGAEPLSGR